MDKIESKVYKSGNSHAIILQKPILKEAEISVGDKVSSYVDNQGRIIIEKKEISFQERWNTFLDSGGTYEEEIDWGSPSGREIW